MSVNSSARIPFNSPYLITRLATTIVEELEQPLGNIFAGSFGLISPQGLV